MSLYGALMTGVSGLSANSAALSVASSNIANVNTVGYKTNQAAFSTLLAASVGPTQVGSAGVTVTNHQNITEQGLLTTASATTDLAISGNGFFVVSKAPAQVGVSQPQYYTRAGDFTPDGSGDLRNSAGYYLMGWALDTNGNIPSDRNDLTAVNINSLSGKATPTTQITFKANLQSTATANTTYAPGDMAAGTVQPDFQRTINVYDSQGGAQPVQMSFVKTGANTWAYEVTYQGDPTNITGTNPIAMGTMQFNDDGTLATADTSAATPTGSVAVTLPWDPTTSGLSPQALTINLGTVGTSDGVTQFSSPSILVSSAVDGALFGSVTGVSIDTDGYVTAQFSNGLTQKIYKLPLATFDNPDGLEAVSGNAYLTTQNSGTPTIGEANTGVAGSINSNALEGSTVDLATEFTNLITTQRAYSASSRIITTASEMLDQLLQMTH